MTPEEQIARVFAWRRGFNATHLIDLGVRLGLFRAFAGTPGATAEAVAQRLGLHAPYVRTWCVTANRRVCFRRWSGPKSSEKTRSTISL